MNTDVIFREYAKPSIDPKPLVLGESPNELIKRRKGFVRIVACGPVNENGKHNISLYNQKRDKYFTKKLTTKQVSRLYKNNGTEIVWVSDDFKFGQICDITAGN